MFLKEILEKRYDLSRNNYYVLKKLNVSNKLFS